MPPSRWILTTSEADAPARYRLKFVPDALAEWQALDGGVKDVLRKALRKRLAQPHVPGAALHGDLRKQGYRLVYSVEGDVFVVLVLAVAKREDMAVYRFAVKRALAEGESRK